MDLLKKAFDKIKNLGAKELTPKISMDIVKNLIKTEKTNIQPLLKTGNIVTFLYDAKDKEQIYDRTPLVLVISTTSKYMLGVNFHWMPTQLRQTLIQYILDLNTKEIRNKRPLKVEYKDIRGAVKRIGAFPVVRLYIRGRISQQGVKIPDSMLMQAAKLATETFTGGKVNSATLWQRAKIKAQTAARKILK